MMSKIEKYMYIHAQWHLKILRLSFEFLLETILKSLHASMISKKYSLVLLRKVWYAIFFLNTEDILILTLLFI